MMECTKRHLFKKRGKKAIILHLLNNIYNIFIFNLQQLIYDPFFIYLLLYISRIKSQRTTCSTHTYHEWCVHHRLENTGLCRLGRQRERRLVCVPAHHLPRPAAPDDSHFLPGGHLEGQSIEDPLALHVLEVNVLKADGGVLWSDRQHGGQVLLLQRGGDYTQLVPWSQTIGDLAGYQSPGGFCLVC